MKAKELLQQVFGLTTVVLLLVGCGGGEKPPDQPLIPDEASSLAEPSLPVSELNELVGDWVGKGAGAEVRFRRQASFQGGSEFNVMTLTTKHATEFYFHVFEDGSIKGEGVILYNLEPDLSGVDALASTVKGLIVMMPMPAAPGSGALSQMADKMAGGMTSAPGVTSPSYSYKMRNAPQQRRYIITGRAVKKNNKWYIRLETTGEYKLSDGTVDNKLWVDYEVNLVHEEKSFPTWSPFLKSESGDGRVRKAAGGTVYMADSEYSGTHRDGVEPWQEYTFSWTARKN
jgi:hypothetical protein